MRARIAIYKAQQTVILRDIVLNNKPKEMIAASAKATVPVLVLTDSTVLAESLAVMLWALNETDPDNLLQSPNKWLLTEMLALINTFDHDFKACLEKYKCAKRYREANVVECREVCEQYLELLENRLSSHLFLMSNTESLADIALLPFIRQFARIERQWYLQSPYPKVRQWLNNYLQSKMFTKVMAKYPLWLDNHEIALFGGVTN
jgi:glutathione S-transferase